MRQLRAICDLCEEVQIPDRDYTVIHEVSRDQYYYNARCNGHNIFKPLSSVRIANLLKEAGVRVESIDVEELRIEEGLPLEEMAQGPMIQNDVNNFMIDLYTLSDEQILTEAGAMIDASSGRITANHQ